MIGALQSIAQNKAIVRPVDAPLVLLQYDNKDITADISPLLQELTYTDNLEGESDSLDIRLEDADGRWISAWYPQHGDTITAQLGYTGSPLLACGVFEIDEIELEGPPDTVIAKALAVRVKHSAYTCNRHLY